MKIYSLFDKAAKRYGTPFVSINHQVALREFAMACKDEKSPMAMFPNDIELTYIGDFNEETGVITPNDKAVTLTCAKEFWEPKINKQEAKKDVPISAGQTNGNN